MLRLAVVVQLVLTLAAGPALCCCGPARLVGAGRASESPPRKACPNCHPESVPPGDESPAEPCHCPCKERAAMADPASDAGVADALGALGPATEPAAVARTCVATSPVPRPTFAPRLPSLSTADILFAHHNLRC